MASRKFTEAAQNLSKAADVAIESIKKYPPKYWEDGELNHVVNWYNERLFFINNPEPKFQNMRSLKYLQEDVLLYFKSVVAKMSKSFGKE